MKLFIKDLKNGFSNYMVPYLCFFLVNHHTQLITEIMTAASLLFYEGHFQF